MLPLIEQEQSTETANRWPLGLAMVLLGGFVGWERRRQRAGKESLIHLHLLRSRAFALSGAVGLAFFAGYPGLLFILSLYLQQGLGYSALGAGAAGLPVAVGSAISALASGGAVYRMGRLMVLLGLAAAALGLVATALIIRTDPHGTIWLDLLVPLLVAGLGSGLVIGPNQTLALQHVAPAFGGTAAAMLQTAQRIGMSIGTAVVATLLFGRLSVARGGYSTAASTSLFGAAAMAAVALVIAAVDLAVNRRPHDGEMSNAAAASRDESVPDVAR
ncbi:MFS transporter [Cellulomonas sp. P24]|uniref:MFS transporter n=1 Tax=Cellulomonas sp. P24 TaxID=2885206 RepID=UPI00216AE47E|nr:MFS transporter [Cellulomonas sp. P24]MCR6493626.1 MFS transporter [Cellulomonas sp. P24]